MFDIFNYKENLVNKTRREKLDRIFEIMQIFNKRLNECEYYDEEDFSFELHKIFIHILIAKGTFNKEDYSLLKMVYEHFNIDVDTLEAYDSIAKYTDENGETFMLLSAKGVISDLLENHSDSLNLWCEMYMNIAMLDNILDKYEYNLIANRILKDDDEIFDNSDINGDNHNIAEQKKYNNIKTLNLLKNNIYSEDEIVEFDEEEINKEIFLRIIFEVENTKIDLDNLVIDIDGGNGQSFDDEGHYWEYYVEFFINDEDFYGFTLQKTDDYRHEIIVEKIEEKTKKSDGKYHFQIIARYVLS